MFTNLGLVTALLSLPYTSLANPITNHQGATPSLQLARDKTIISRADASSYPYGVALPNEFQWRNWDPEDNEHKETAMKIHNAFIEWHVYCVYFIMFIIFCSGSREH